MKWKGCDAGMVYKNRYNRNMNTLSPEENARLKEFRVFIAGCGGLGGFLVEELGKMCIRDR